MLNEKFLSSLTQHNGCLSGGLDPPSVKAAAYKIAAVILTLYHFTMRYSQFRTKNGFLEGLIFTPTKKLKDGTVIRPKKGKCFAFWVRIEKAA